MADEIIVLQNGEKILQDTPKNIFSNHENPSIFGLKRTQINEIVQLVNLNKKYLKQNILTVDEAIDEIIVKTHHKRGLNL